VRGASPLARAAELYRAGRRRESEALLREVLTADPESADALFYLGSIAADAGRLGRALQLLQRAVARRPMEAAFHAALGNALARAGRAGDALASFQAARALQPALLELLLNAGHALRALGRHDEALAAYAQLIARQPAHAAARLGRALALAALGRRDAALAEFEQARAAAPDALDYSLEEAGLHLALGEAPEAARRYAALLERPGADARLRLNVAAALVQGGDVETALAQLRELERSGRRDAASVVALADLYSRCGEHGAALRLLEPLLAADDLPEWRERVARELLELERHADAAEHLRKLIAVRPADPGMRANLGLALLGLDRVDEASAELREALRLAPRHWQALHALGLALLKRGEIDEAIDAFEQARALKADEPDLLSNLGYAYALARQFERGEPLLREAVALAPGHRRARRNLGHYHLVRGRFEEGWLHSTGPWDEYRVRNSGQRFAQPWWQGEPLAGRSLLVWSEQGLGDQIMFCNPVPDLAAQGARVTLQCEPRLKRLFARSFPGVDVVPRGPQGQARIERAAPELQVPMSQLPVYLRRSRAAFPRHSGYLRADAKRVAYWRGRLEALGTEPRVGVSWVGGTVKTGKSRRSMTLEDWLPVLRLPGLRFVSLQYTDCRAELAWLRERHGLEVTHWQEAIDDYDETAALVTALDAVASVCTAVVHLAGALDRPARVAVPWWPAWCFMLEGEEMPWYPSVRLIRQQEPNDWDAPMARIAGEIAALVRA
jgi:Flp pilus assembly protein TadD